MQLATEYGGKFLLVLVNTDELGQVAHQFGVTSVPTVKFFRNGQVTHTIHGAESDSDFRKDIGRRGLVVLCDMLGNSHPLTAQCRPLLVDSLI